MINVTTSCVAMEKARIFWIYVMLTSDVNNHIHCFSHNRHNQNWHRSRSFPRNLNHIDPASKYTNNWTAHHLGLMATQVLRTAAQWFAAQCHKGRHSVTNRHCFSCFWGSTGDNVEIIFGPKNSFTHVFEAKFVLMVTLRAENFTSVT